MFIRNSTRKWDVGEKISLHKNKHHIVPVIRRGETYKRWAGAQVCLSSFCNSLSSLSTNNLSVYFSFGTSWSIISVCCPMSAVCAQIEVERRIRSRYRLGG